LLHEFGDDPAGFERGVINAGGGHRPSKWRVDGDADLGGAVDVHEEEAGGVPDFVGEGAVAFGSGHVEGDVGAGRGHGRQREADGIGAVLLDDLDGVDDVALGLGHLFAVGVADQGVDVDLAEGNRVGERARAPVGHGDVLGEPDAQHDHAGDPEEEDVEAGDEEAGGVERVEVGAVLDSPVPNHSDSGQPKTETGSRPEENQVSRTSVSWVILSEPQWAQAVGSPVARLGTVILPQVAQCQAGMRGPTRAGG
jgi:hypothetical protein